ncbi:SpoIIIAC/SpoIIIAD family protein [Ruminococcus sp.]|uniref:SpoIIIAC/SpoIIIAD family protein n=1 Tax=Ruminococcus sp. TaxID=41978 RepID=UPI0025CDFBB5|nr:SpoIIIAC/SpoIIIAD family protein [Ruminococcus sp.]MBQ8965249.1 stage III sporulation protein AD [Ruminococcus sp.]
MEILVVCAFAVVAAMLCKTLEVSAREIRLILIIGASAAVFLKAAGSLGSIIAEIRSMFSDGGIDSDYIRILLKSLGICYITNFASGVCRDSGEQTLAEHTLLAGKVALLITALPMIEALTEIIKTLLI